MWRLGSYRNDPGADSGVFTKGGGFKINYKKLTLHLRFHKKIIREKHERGYEAGDVRIYLVC